MDPIMWKQLGEWRLEELRRDARRRAFRPPPEPRRAERPQPGAVRRAIAARWPARLFRAH